MKATNNSSKFDTLTELGLRPVSQVFNQIRYWSALDEPDEEKWDYVSHYTRTERREMGLGGAAAAPLSHTVNVKPLIAAVLVALLLVGVGTGLFLAWPTLTTLFSKKDTASTDLTVVTGYMMHLGSRDLGVIEDKDAMEAYVTQWLDGNNATAGEGITYKIAQDITYEEVRIGSVYCATLSDVENAFVKHATLAIA